MALHRIAATAQQTDRATLLLVCALAAVLAARANADLACPALPAPATSTGVRLAYFDDAGDDMQPTWQGAARTAATLPLGTLAVFSCPSGKELFVGNRSQRTAGSTYNRTCTRLSDEAAAFLPMQPPKAALACRTMTNASRVIPRCGVRQAACGSASCCAVGDACDHRGLQGRGLCCPKGSEPCGGELCCGAGEACLVAARGQDRDFDRYNLTAKCCSKGATPCGSQCCNPGERCFPNARKGRGLCCPGPGYTPCWPQPHNGDAHAWALTGEAWDCCAPGDSCMSTLAEQDDLEEDYADNVRPRPWCCPGDTTRCGWGCCEAYQDCVDGQCVLRNKTMALNLTSCAGWPCPPGRCVDDICAVSLMKPCGKHLCMRYEECYEPQDPKKDALCCIPPFVLAPNKTACQLKRVPGAGTLRGCGGAECGTGGVYGWSLPNGRCHPGEESCGDQCCQIGSCCCGSVCCPSGGTCCGGKECCTPSSGTRCCGDTCCRDTDQCKLRSAKPPGGTARGSCVAAATACAAGAVPCWGRCCAAGQACSRDGMRCCSPHDVTCLLSGEVASVQCGATAPANLTCRLWDQTCVVSPVQGEVCVDDGSGTAPCADTPDKVCPARSVCGPAWVPWIVGSDDVRRFLNPTCCPNDTLPCGGLCCGKGEWCHGWFWDSAEAEEGPPLLPRCFPRSYRPCGHTACPGNYTCYSSALFGQGLCCPPGEKPYRSGRRDGSIDWALCAVDN